MKKKKKKLETRRQAVALRNKFFEYARWLDSFLTLFFSPPNAYIVRFWLKTNKIDYNIVNSIYKQNFFSLIYVNLPVVSSFHTKRWRQKKIHWVGFCLSCFRSPCAHLKNNAGHESIKGNIISRLFFFSTYWNKFPSRSSGCARCEFFATSILWTWTMRVRLTRCCRPPSAIR